MTGVQILLVAYPAWVLLLVALVVTVRRQSRRATRPAVLTASDLDLFEGAFLSGGPLRVVDVAVLALRGHKSLIISREGSVSATGRDFPHPLPADVLGVVTAEGGSTYLSTLRARGTATPSVQGVGTRLSEAGLLRAPRSGTGCGTGGCTLALLIVLTIIGQWVSLGIPPISNLPIDHAGEFAGLIVERIVGMMVLILSLTLLASARPPGIRTPAGDAALRELRRDTMLRENLAAEFPGGEGLGPVAIDGAFRIQDADMRKLMSASLGSSSGTGSTTGTTPNSDDLWSMHFNASHGTGGGTSSSDGGGHHHHHHSSDSGSSGGFSDGGGHHHH